MKMATIIAESVYEITKELANLIEQVAHESINKNGKFLVGVSGGSLITFLTDALQQINTDFTKWKIFFNDERLVAPDNPDSTFGAYKANLVVGKALLTEEQFVRIKPNVSAEEAAKDYIQQMSGYFTDAWPNFDMLLLGMGPDGHTCSLFPDHKLLNENSVWVAAITDSPKPPPARITFTFPVINNARNCVFVMAGEGKADMVKRVLVDKEDLPVTRVAPTKGKVTWILDKAAAKHLKS